MADRESISIRNVDKGIQPVPMGSKLDKIVYSSPIPPLDPDVGAVPESPDAQAAALFKNIRAFVDACGATPDRIVHMSISLRDPKYRARPRGLSGPGGTTEGSGSPIAACS